MNRGLAFILLLVIVVGYTFLATGTSALSLLSASNSPVLFTYDGVSVNLATLCWIILGICAWITLTVLGFTIDPYLGELIFRLGLWLIIIWFDRDFKISPSRSGSGSGKATRVG